MDTGWIYYQTVEHSRQEWLLAPWNPDHLPEDAYHVGIYRLDKPPEETEESKLRYAGDLWFDIDHKPASDESIEQALARSIQDVHKLANYLQAIHVDLSCVEFFASGGKGFHVRIPCKMFGGRGFFAGLPLMHKYMAYAIQELAGITGLDRGLYCMGKGRLLRQPNKRRANGAFKVPMVYEILKDCTPEVYLSMVATPKTTGFLNPSRDIVVSTELRQLFDDAKNEVKQALSAKPQPISDSILDGFADKAPRCAVWLADHQNIKQEPGSFNGAKMGMARYLGGIGLESHQTHPLLERFAKNWESDRAPTVAARTSAVKQALKYGKEQGFSCERVLLSFTSSPCQGCPVQEERHREASESSGILESGFGYFKHGAKGAVVMLSNFTLRPTVAFASEEGGNSFVAHTFNIYIGTHPDEGQPSGSLTIEVSDWSNATSFTRKVNQFNGVKWIGSPQELQNLYSYIASDAMLQGVKCMRSVRTVGVYRHVDPSREIDEFVWVQPGWSINAANVADTVRFSGQSQEEGGAIVSPCLDFRRISSVHTDKTVEMYHKLLDVNAPEVVATVMGWTIACWLKPHVNKDATELQFPLLELCGPATCGKTLTAKTFSILAGADLNGRGLLTASSSTPYSLRVEASMTTTVPRVFDEVNQHKMARSRYADIVEVLKAAASGNALAQGKLSSNRQQVLSDKRVASSPMVFCATQHSIVKEIQERSVTIQLSHMLRAGRDILPVDRGKVHLEPLAKQLMEATLRTEVEWVHAMMDEAEQELPDSLTDRFLRNYQIIMLGLKFLLKVLTENSYPEATLLRTKGLQKHVLDYLVGTVIDQRSSQTQQEVDVIIDIMSQMALPNARGNQLEPGVHYVVQGKVLHIQGILCFQEYLRECASTRTRPELQTAEQMLRLVTHTPYYVGTGLYTDAFVPTDWWALDLIALRERGVVVQRFAGAANAVA